MKEIKRDFEDLKRSAEVSGILTKNGLALLKDRFHSKRPREDVTASRLRKTFEDLGPAFVKFGQLMSERPDLVPQEYIDELSKLQDHSPEFSSDKARQIVDREIGLERLDGFEEEPIASASIAQVHKASINGKEVILKIRRPGIKEKIQRDFDIIRYLAGKSAKYSTFLRDIDVESSAEQFENWTKQELNLQREMYNAVTLAQNLKDNNRVRIPEVYPDFTTERVLAMEYIEAFKIGDDEKIDQYGLDRHELALTGVEIGINQIVRDGFFHADAHESNFLIDKEGRIIMLDFGMMGSITEKTQRQLALLFLYIAREDVDGCVDIILEMGEVGERTDIEKFREDIEREIMTLKNSNAQQQTVSHMTLSLIEKAGKNRVKMPHSIVIVGKSMVTLEGIILKIYPEMDLREEYSKRMKKILKEKNRPREIKEKFSDDLEKNKGLITKSPSYFQEFFETEEAFTEHTVNMYNSKLKVLGLSLIVSSILLLVGVFLT